MALPSPHVPGGLAEAEVGQLQERTRTQPARASGHLRIRGVCKTSSSHRQQGLQLLKSQLSASGILNSLLIELVCQFQPFPDGRSRPASHTLWSVGCVPRPLQQVQANRQRVERRQPRLHGALHPEQGREQEARQKCELRLSFQHSFIQITSKVGEAGDLPSRAMERGDSAQSFASSLAR